MQTDLSDGVRALTRTGIVDPKRVCIVGASYGGYAALAGAAIVCCSALVEMFTPSANVTDPDRSVPYEAAG